MSEKGRDSSSTGGNHLPATLISPPTYAGLAALSDQERRQTPVFWSELAVPQAILGLQPRFLPDYKAKQNLFRSCMFLCSLSKGLWVCPRAKGWQRHRHTPQATSAQNSSLPLRPWVGRVLVTCCVHGRWDEERNLQLGVLGERCQQPVS